MGCDIHMSIEVLMEWNGIYKWLNADHYELSMYDQHAGGIQYDPIDIYDKRDYDLFAMLANVRNYNNLVPIMEPRGKPSDLSWITSKRIEDYGSDGHSHSYFTLKELKEHATGKEYGGMNDLINSIHERKNDVFGTRGLGNTNTEYDDRIRIVFWFDN